MACRPPRRHGRALPADSTFERISNDGQRISLYIPDPPSPYDVGYRIWNDGALVAPPGYAVMSKDLRFAVTHAAGPHSSPYLYRWELATGASTQLTTAALNRTHPIGISDDGAIAWYGLSPAPCQIEFVAIDTGVVDRHDRCGAIVSASGRHLLVQSDFVTVQDSAGNNLGGPTRLQLVPSGSPGTVLTEVTATPGSHLTEVHLADTQPVFWAAEVRWEGNITQPCGTPSTPPCVFEEETLSLIVGTQQGSEQLAVEPDLATAYTDEPRRTDLSGDGRFLVYAGSDNAIHVPRPVLRTARGAARRWRWAIQAARQRRRQGHRHRIGNRSGIGVGWFEYLAEDA